jgi:hypothetical protein
MLVRIGLFTFVVAALLVAVSKGGLLERVGLVGSCQEVAAPQHTEGVWQRCRAGKLEGRPDLRRDSCHSAGIYQGLEYWECPERLSVDRRPNG